MRHGDARRFGAAAPLSLSRARPALRGPVLQCLGAAVSCARLDTVFATERRSHSAPEPRRRPALLAPRLPKLAPVASGCTGAEGCVRRRRGGDARLAAVEWESALAPRVAWQP
eukprot:scaffold48_cov311-Pinguiococcus_pyrenoidosus.AAC.59